jgi:hypothetical protein
VPNAEAAVVGTAVSGGPEFAIIAVRTGNLVYGISIPPPAPMKRSCRAGQCIHDSCPDTDLGGAVAGKQADSASARLAEVVNSGVGQAEGQLGSGRGSG